MLWEAVMASLFQPIGLAVAACATALAVSSCDSTEATPETGDPACDNLDESACLFPFPSNFFRKEGGPYGQAFHLDFGPSMPVSTSTDIRMSPEPFKVHDGFPIVSAITFSLKGASVKGAPSLADIDASMRPDSKTLVIDAETGELAAHWTELDYHAEDAGERIVEVRLAKALRHDRRYVVAVHGLVDDAGSVLPPTRGFAALRDRTRAPVVGIEARRERFEREVFPVIERAGVPRKELQLAWDFTTTTERSSISRLLTMRDRLYAAIGDQGPEYTVTKVEKDPAGQDGPIAAMIEGVAKVPSFVLPEDPPGYPRHLRLDGEGLPRIEGFEDVVFHVQIPRIALTSPSKMGVVQYGHGFLGHEDEAYNDWMRQWANRHGFLVLSCDMQGMNIPAGIIWFIRLPQDATNMAHVAEEPLQGVINHLALQRLMKGRFLSDPNIQRAGEPMYDPGRVYYNGNSQGGTMGNLVFLPSLDVKRAVLGEPGVAIGFLLARAVEWEERGDMLFSSYPSPYDFAAVMSLVQVGWDKTDGINFAPRWADLPGTPPKRVLLQGALEDAQVNNDVTHLLARLYRTKLIEPATRPVYGLETAASPVVDANAFQEVDYGVPPHPATNRPALRATDTHDLPYKTVPIQDQAWHFLETGEAKATCDGVCDPL
jgi:hypothetical protein